MKEISFIHCADLHLDSPMIGLKNLPSSIRQKLQESTFVAFKNIVDCAIERHVDFIIIAGDIFDVEDRSLRAQIRFRKEMERLQEHHIDVFILHGNHDHLSGKWVSIVFPENVKIFPTDVTMIPYQKGDINVHLYGFSYEQRHLYDRKIKEYKKIEGADFHIGILHGNLEGTSDHGPYAPFHISELNEKHMDYWALGHIHKRAILQQTPPVVYPGNIQGRHKKETGEKGCYYVKISEKETELEFLSCADIVWEIIKLDGKDVNSFDELYALCLKAIDEKRENNYSSILVLEIENIEKIDHFNPNELLEIVQTEDIDQSPFVWVSSIKIKENTIWLKENLQKESEFYQQLFTISSDYEQVEKAVSNLYHHPVAHRYLSALTEDEQKEMAEEAEELLMKLLNP